MNLACTSQALSAHQIVHEAGDASAKNEAPISICGDGALAEKVYRQFQCVHDANEIDVDDVHAWFGRRSRWIW